MFRPYHTIPEINSVGEQDIATFTFTPGNPFAVFLMSYSSDKFRGDQLLQTRSSLCLNFH